MSELNDDEFNAECRRLLGAQAAAADQLQSHMATVAGFLGQLRTQLIINCYSTDGAEDHTPEFFIRLLDGEARIDEDP